MSFLDTRHKRKSVVLTVSLLTALVLLLFYIGLSYTEEPLERGIAINFGVASEGQGLQAQSPRRAQSPQVQDIAAPAPQQQESSQPTAEEVEEVLTQADSELVIKEAEEKPTPAGEENKADESIQEEAVPEPPKPSEQTQSVLSKFIKGSKTPGKEASGEGVSQGAEDQGSPDGNPYASTYYGPSTTGSGTSGYGLSGRSLRSRQAVEQDCNQAGRVVVKITVDRSGKVIAAEPGVQGTTNLAACLMEPAKKTAFSYQWNADPKAPAKQVGFVVVNFRLGQ